MHHKTVLLVLAGLGLAGSLAVLAKEPPPPDYFPLRVGDWWKYQSTNASGAKSEFTIKVTAFDDQSKVYTVETTAGPTIIDEFYTKPPGWVMWHKEIYVKNSMTAEFQPGPRKFLQNPPGKDSAWDWSGTGMMNTQIDDKEAYAGSDPIVVPAGKFSGVHVHGDVTQGGAAVKKDYWYANWVGLVKSQTDS
ncbi:MAG TPA: hypothetical protein VGO93_22890, partial [Candidatus Xenobia bacterium]